MDDAMKLELYNTIMEGTVESYQLIINDHLKIDKDISKSAVMLIYPLQFYIYERTDLNYASVKVIPIVGSKELDMFNIISAAEEMWQAKSTPVMAVLIAPSKYVPKSLLGDMTPQEFMDRINDPKTKDLYVGLAEDAVAFIGVSCDRLMFTDLVPTEVIEGRLTLKYDHNDRTQAEHGKPKDIPPPISLFFSAFSESMKLDGINTDQDIERMVDNLVVASKPDSMLDALKNHSISLEDL